MSYHHWILLAAFLIFALSGLFLLLALQKNKGPADPAPIKGNIKSAIIYSLTGAMSPAKKESAYLHLPSYIAGMIFHMGTFLSFAWLLVFFFNIKTAIIINHISSLILCVAALCGFGILLKRMLKVNLRRFSNPDDYLSNILVTGFQVLIALAIREIISLQFLFIYSACLLLYINIGKLRHVIYFLSSRIQLGQFYGRRGVWPSKK
jgi:hypothetical protein